MEEIQVEEYVRTKTGRITKIIKIDKCIITVGHGMQEIKLYAKFSNSHVIHANNYQELYKEINKYITKHSKNIMDLIEVGDIVNDYKILNIVNLNNSDKKVFTICKSDFKDICRVWGEKDISTILTHEQYENNCYRIGE